MRGGANENKPEYVKLTGDIDEKNIIGKRPKKGHKYLVTYHKDARGDDSIMVLTDKKGESFGIRTGMSDTNNNTIFAFTVV